MKKMWMITALILFFAPSALAAGVGEYQRLSDYNAASLACGRAVSPNDATSQPGQRAREAAPALSSDGG